MTITYTLPWGHGQKEMPLQSGWDWELQLHDFTSWVTLRSRCNAITVTDVSAITAQDA